MAADLVTPDNVSVELLNGIFAPYMETAFDDDGNLLLNGDCQVYVTIIPDKSSIRMTTIFRIKEDCGQEARLAAANRINSDYVMLKAHCSDNDKLIFTYYFMLAGGITRNALVRGAKLFDSIPREAIYEHAEDIIC